MTARLVAEVQALRPRWCAFNLAVGPDFDTSGPAVVIAATEGTRAIGEDRFAASRWIGEPFAKDDLLAACRLALGVP